YPRFSGPGGNERWAAAKLPSPYEVFGDGACGRCATVCPNDAIKVSVDDPDFLEKCYKRISSYVDFGAE
ncbi:MAG TPA: 4Fe-4S binding protein, partial [Candidatus Anoxymicrobiaceae bacterium]